MKRTMNIKKKHHFNIISAFLAAAVLWAGFCLSGTDVCAADTASVTVKVSMKHEEGTVSVTGMEERTIPAGGTESYVFTCTEPGTYTYEVRQTGAAPGAKMDATVYELTVYAQYEGDGQTESPRLTASAYVKEQGKTDKKAELSFDNTIPEEDLQEQPDTPKEPDSGPHTGNPSNTGKNVTTGDPGNAGVWMLLQTFVMSGLLIIFRSRKREREGRKIQ